MSYSGDSLHHRKLQSYPSTISVRGVAIFNLIYVLLDVLVCNTCVDIALFTQF